MPEPIRKPGSPSLTAPKPAEQAKPYRGGTRPERPVVQQQSMFYSGGVHLAILLFVWAGLPNFFKQDIPDEEPIVVSLVDLPLTEKSNVRKSDLPLAKTPKPPKVVKQPPIPPKQSESTPPPIPVPPKPAHTPEPPKETPPPATTPDQTVVPKPPEPPKPPKTPPKETKATPTPPKTSEKPKKNEQDELDQILKDVRKQAVAADDPKPTKDTSPSGAQTRSSSFDPNSPEGLALKDNIRQQLIRCWNPPAGVKDDFTLNVIVKAHFNPDGSLAAPAPQITGGNESHPSFQAAASAALRAVNRCAPLKNLPAKMYDGSSGWNEVELKFNPEFLH